MSHYTELRRFYHAAAANGQAVLLGQHLTSSPATTAPPGRGPVISSVDNVPGDVAPLFDPGNATVPITWCAQDTTTCMFCWRLPRRRFGSSRSRPLPPPGPSWVVVTLSGIGIGLALWALLEILFAGRIGIHGLLK
jgi:hypothetical protein